VSTSRIEQENAAARVRAVLLDPTDDAREQLVERSATCDALQDLPFYRAELACL
jgi:hypothetical protein